MKYWTYFRLILLSLCLGACSRNPLGEDLAQPILNLGFLLSQSCSNTLNQDAPYTCTITPAEVVPNLVFSIVPGTSCTWATVDPVTGIVTGTPNDNNVGVCQIVVGARSPTRRAQNITYNVQVQNVAPTLTITNAAAILEDASLTVIRNDAAVQSSEEGFGTYSFDHANTTLPRCTDNAAQLLIDANTGAVSYAPALNYNGTCNIRVAFNDGNNVASSVVTSEFSITVTSVNDAPTITPLATQTTPESTTANISLTVVDVDSPISCSGPSITVTSSNTALVPAPNISLSGTIPNCILTMIPVALASGTTTVTVTATDGSLTASMNFDLIVVPFPNPPVLALIANQLGTEDTLLSFNINISDPDTVLACNSTNLSVTSSNPSLIPVANILFSGVPPTCLVTLSPVADQNGTSNLVISLNDGTTTVTRSFSATFSPVNDAPLISVIANQTTIEDTPISFNFTISDVDNILTCAGSVAPTSSNLALLPLTNIAITGTAPNCTATLTPVADANGLTNLSFTVSDGSSTNVRNFSLTVNAVNDAPVISAITNQTTPEDTPITVNFTLSDIDSAVSCTTSVSATSSNLTVLPLAGIVFGGTIPNCTVTLTSAANQSGTSAIGLTATDGSLTAVSNFNLVVTAVNDPPVFSVIANQTTNEDAPVAFNFTITDVDNALSCSTSMSVSSSNTTLIPVANIVFSGTAPNCTATLTSLANQNGVSNLTFTLTDGTTPVAQTISLTVTAVNDAPVMSAITNQTTPQDTAMAVNFTITDIDSTLTCGASVTATSTNTTLLPVANIVFSGTAPNCTATLTPVFLQNGSSTVGFTVSDGSLTDVKSFLLTVTAFNYPPTISAIANQTTPEDTLLAVNFTISDVDNTLTCASSMSATSSNTALIPVANIVFTGTAPNCTATLTSLANQNGTSNLNLTVTDGSSNVSQGFTFTVTAVNDAPVISAIGNQTINEDNNVVVNFTITDVDNVLTCAGSLSATSSNAGLLPVASIVFGGTAPNCTATLTPVADANGVSTVGFTVSDGTLTDVKSFNLTVSAVNDAPVMSAITNQSTPEDTPLTVNFTITDVDSVLICTSANLTATSSNTGLIPVASIVFGGTAPNCTATFTSVADMNGVSNITFTVDDGGVPNLQNTKSFTYTVTAVNDAPVLSALANQTINEDGSVAVNFTITDVDSALNCVTSMGGASSNTGLLPNANIVFSGTAPNCTMTLTPVANANGVSNLTILVTDGTANDVKLLTLTVTAVNDAPVMSAITNKTTPQDTAIAVNFTISDVDSVLTCGASVVATSSNTTLVPVANIVFSGTAPNCTATLTPVFLQNGITSIGFTVSDGSLTDVKNFALTVSAFNYQPTISAISNQTTAEDTPLAVNFTISDVDDTLTCAGSMSATSSNTALIPVANIVFTGTAPNCTATLTSLANQNGVSNLTFTVTDGNTPVSQGPFTFTVTAVNDAPVISAITAKTTLENAPIAVNFTITDIDSTLNCATSVSASSSNTGLVPVANIVFSGTAPNCTATITPVATINGVATLGLTVSDGSLSDVQSFSLTVTPVNDAPVISAITAKTTAEDTPLAVNFTISDIDSTLNCSTSMTATSSNTGLVPVASIVFSGTAPNCTATISSAADANGVSTIGLTVSDGSLSNSSSFTFTVTAVNDAPVISAITNQTTAEDTPLAINFTITDVDSTLTCATSLSATSSNIAVIPVASIVFTGTAPNCTATLTPVLDANGVSNLVFTVTDGVLTNNQSFSFTVTAVNDAPVMSAITNKTTAEDTPLAVNFTITDVDSTLTCSSSVVATSTNTALIPVASIVFTGTAPNCTATLTSLADTNGVSTLSFTVSDGTLTDAKSFTFTVTPVNDAPVMAAIANQTTPEDTPLAVNFTITDIDSTLSCTTAVTATSSNVGVIPVASIVFSGTAPNCTATLTPVANASGVSTLGFTVADSGALTDVKNFTFTVTAVNDAPVMAAISNQTTSEDTALAVNFTISDVDSAVSCTTSLSATSSNTGLIPVANVVFSGTAPNCTATVSPVANLNGVTTLGFTVTDGSLTDVKSFTFTVTAVNDAPVISAITNQTTNEDTPITVNFTITDIDSVLLCTSLNLSATSSNTTLLPIANIVFGGTAPNCTATITPVADGNGASNLNITLNDNGAPNLQASQAFTLTVTPVNDAPTQSAIANQTTLEDTAKAINFTIADVDSTLTCAGSLSASSSNTTIIPVANIVFTGTAPNCTATITPATDQNGILNLTFRVSDTVLFQDQTFQLTVTAVDDAPVISAVSNQSINEDTSATVNYTITDVDSTLSCTTSMSANSSNTALLPVANIVFTGTAPNCTATLSPAANAAGASTVSLTVTDGTTPVTRTFSLTVTPVNDAPVMSAIANQTTAEDTPLAVNFTITDIDSTLTCASSVTASSSNTSIVAVAGIVFSGTAPNCTATITPVADAAGVSTIGLTVTDGSLSDTKSFTFTVTPVDDPPVASLIGDQIMSEDTILTVNFTITDVDSTLACTSASLSATDTNNVILPVANITFSGTAPNCTIRFQPFLNQNGILNVTLTVTDGTTPVSQTFELNVLPVDDPPTMAAITGQTTLEDTAKAVNFTINDVDSVLSCVSSMNVISSNVALMPAANVVFSGTAPNCTATFTPVANKFGNSNITLFVNDGMNTASRAFTLSVTAVNDAPVMSAIGNQSTVQSTPLAVNFTITDVDNVLNCATSVTGTSSNQTEIPDANIIFTGTAPNCTATLTPTVAEVGSANITFTVTDTPGLTDTKTFVFTTTVVNNAPTISAVSNQTIYEARPNTFNFTVNDADGPLNCTSSTLSASSSNTTLVPVANVTFSGTYPNCMATVRLANGQAGTSNVTITATDGAATASTVLAVTGYKITSVALSPLNPIVPKNSDFSFNLAATYSDGQVKNVTSTSTWTTSNTTVTSYPTAGVLRNNYAGATVTTSTITGSYGSFSANTTATINPATITGLIVNTSSATITVGSTLQIACMGITSDGGVVDLTQSCSWTSANALIASVDDSMDKGLITGQSLGSATNITASYSTFTVDSAITVDTIPPVQSDDGTGLTANYYSGINFDTFVSSRRDATVNFNWGTGNNPTGLADVFSVRWTGYIKAPTSGSYTFYTQSDEGVRLWVNGVQLVNNWANHASIEDAGSITLTAGTKYSITLEYFENTGAAQIELRYSGPSVGKQIIPQMDLYP